MIILIAPVFVSIFVCIALVANVIKYLSTGIMGCIGVCAVGAYKYKNRGQMSTSVFLMQLRVAAQGTAVAALTIGMAYSLADRYLFKSDKKSE